MRKLLFAKDEVLIPVDQQDLEDCPSLDASALYAALCLHAPDTDLGSTSLVCVLSGLTVTSNTSSEVCTFTIAPGSLVYRLVSPNTAATYKIATIRSPITVSTIATSVGNHKSVWIELTVTEVTTDAVRTFKKDVAGRIVLQDEPTPKYLDAVISVRLREGTTTSVASTPYLPAWDANTLPVATAIVGELSTAIRDVRKVYKADCRGTFLARNLQATVDASAFSSVHYHTMTKNYAGFGSESPSPIDYVPISLNQQTVTNTITPAANKLGYLYVLRPFPNMAAVEYVMTDKPPTYNRRMNTDFSIEVLNNWPAGTLVAGHETCYLYPVWYSESAYAVSTTTNGNTTYLYKGVASTTATSSVASSINGFNQITSRLPPTARRWKSRLSYFLTLPVPEPRYYDIRIGNSIFLGGTDDLMDRDLTFVTEDARECRSLETRPMQFSKTLDAGTSGDAFIKTDFQGPDSDNFQMFQVLVEVTEWFV